jgi:hypothetical protein
MARRTAPAVLQVNHDQFGEQLLRPRGVPIATSLVRQIFVDSRDVTATPSSGESLNERVKVVADKLWIIERAAVPGRTSLYYCP